MISVHEPIFIICTGRSGSTMLRYILDSHDKIDAPHELHLGPMIKEMTRVVRLIHEIGVAENIDLEDLVNKEVNSLVDSIIRAKFKNEIWCDKSVSSIDYIDEIMQVFPKAKYIFLYRDCLDFVHSALEVSKFGFEGFYFEEFILKTPKNLVNGLVNFWNTQTEKRIKLVKNQRHSIHQIKYEDIVKNPSDTLKPLFHFLGLAYSDKLLENIFSKFRPGKGDIKVQSSGSILDMTGKGRDVPLKYIEKETFKKMNAILKQIGYPEIDSNYNYSGDGISKPVEIDQDSVDRMFKYFESRFENIPCPTELENYKISIEISGVKERPWSLDFQNKAIYRNQNGQKDITFKLKVRADSLLKIVDKELNISWAYNQGMIETNGTDQQLNEVGKYFFG